MTNLIPSNATHHGHGMSADIQANRIDVCIDFDKRTQHDPLDKQQQNKIFTNDLKVIIKNENKTGEKEVASHSPTIVCI